MTNVNKLFENYLNYSIFNNVYLFSVSFLYDSINDVPVYLKLILNDQQDKVQVGIRYQSQLK